MITLRLACCTILVAALTAGCASAPAVPVVSPTIAAGAPSLSGPPAPSATDVAVRLSGNGALAAGRYYLDNRQFTNATRLTITVPAGWTTEEYGELYKDRDGPGEVKFITWVLTHVFDDVCQWGPLVDVGTTVDELVTALVEQDGREASAPTTVSVGGFPAKRLELTVPAELDTAIAALRPAAPTRCTSSMSPATGWLSSPGTTRALRRKTLPSCTPSWTRSRSNPDVTASQPAERRRWPAARSCCSRWLAGP
jgi:hypothetical protein